MKNVEVRYTFIIFIITAAVVYFITSRVTNENRVPIYQDQSFYINLLVEAHGMLLDILLVGLIVVFFISRSEKKREIDNLTNEIGYIRLLTSEESKFKLKSIILQLNEHKFYKMDLRQCFLSNIELLKIRIINGRLHATNFRGANLSEADFSHSKGVKTFFIGCKMKNIKLLKASMRRSIFNDSDIRNSNFISAKLIKCKFVNSNISNSDFRKCDLTGTSFNNAIAKSCDFRHSNLQNVDFTGANLQSADFTECINLTAEQIKKASNYSKIRVDNALLTQLI